MRFLSYLLLICCAFLPVQADDAENPLTRDLLIFSDWFEGDFDNEEQLWFHARSRSDSEKPVRLHTSHKRVSLPAFGEYVFYVEEYKDNNPEDLIRQRLVTLHSDLERGAIRMKQGFFRNAADVRGAHLDPSKLSEVTKPDVVFLEECDVFIRRVADQFEGSMDEKKCVFGNGDERRYSVHNIALSATKFWRDDATYLLSDNSFFRGTKPGEPAKLRRARTYICDVYFYGETRADQQVVEDLKIHSQGGIGRATREADGQSFEVLLRQKEYPYYETRPDFIYYSVRKAGERRSVAYGVADYNSRQFGLNAGDVGAFCHLEGYSFRQLFEEL